MLFDRQPDLESTSSTLAVVFGRSGGAVQGLGLVGMPGSTGTIRKPLRPAIEQARQSDTPSLIACRTVIGFGAPNRQGTEKAHGAPLGAEEIVKTRMALDWPHQPFQIPEAVIEQWRKLGARGHGARRNWIERTRRLNTGFALAVS